MKGLSGCRMAFAFFLVACIVALLILLIYNSSRLNQFVEGVLTSTLGSLVIVLQNVMHTVDGGADVRPTPAPTQPQGVHP